MRACGYALVEDERPGRFDPEVAKRLGVAEGPDFARLQRGEEVEGAPGRFARRGDGGAARGSDRRDHRRHRALAATVDAAADAELLIHDASFAREDAQRAAETGHSTVRQAAAVAAEAHVKLLALVHISSRYHVGKVLEEAHEVFADRRPPRLRPDRDPLPGAR